MMRMGWNIFNSKRKKINVIHSIVRPPPLSLHKGSKMNFPKINQVEGGGSIFFPRSGEVKDYGGVEFKMR